MIELRELWVCRHIEFFSYVECINSGWKFFFVMEGEIVTHGVLTLRKKKWFTHWFFVYWICPNYDRKDSLTIKERPNFFG